MKKIFDWTAGSFFRTIGRVIAFSVIGYLIAMLLQANDFKLSELFFTRVNASTYSTFYKGSMTYKDLGGSTTNNMTLSNDGLFSRYVSFDSNNLTKTWWAYFPSNQSLSSTSKSIIFNLKLRMNSVNSYDISMSEAQYTCTFTGKYHEYSFPSGNPDIEFEYNTLNCNGHSSTGYADLNEHKFSIIIYYIYNNNDNLYVPCNAIGQAGDTYTFSCPITTDNISGFRIAMSSNMASTMIVGFPALYTIENDNTQAIIDQQNQTNQAITNQTQQQQQQHQEMMDSNTTQAEEEATSFFEDFEVPDAGGLSAIITAPLSTIQSLLNSTCSNLVLPLPFVNENLTLPCLNPIYTEHFGLFFTLYQTIILAIISYRCIRSIFFDIHGFTDPNDDRIEVMDL